MLESATEVLYLTAQRLAGADAVDGDLVGVDVGDIALDLLREPRNLPLDQVDDRDAGVEDACLESCAVGCELVLRVALNLIDLLILGDRR